MNMAKGYWIARVDVKNDGRLQARLRRRAMPAMFAQIRRPLRHARRQDRGGRRQEPSSRVVVIEFPSYQAAIDCYRSPEYAKVKAQRMANADADLIVIEGYDGPQP